MLAMPGILTYTNTMPDLITLAEVQRATCALKQVANKIVLAMPNEAVTRLAHAYEECTKLDREYLANKQAIETATKNVFVEYFR